MFKQLGPKDPMIWTVSFLAGQNPDSKSPCAFATLTFSFLDVPIFLRPLEKKKKKKSLLVITTEAKSTLKSDVLHTAVHLKPTQCCKSTILRLFKKGFVFMASLIIKREKHIFGNMVSYL